MRIIRNHLALGAVFLAVVLALGAASTLRAADPPPRTVEDVARASRGAVAVIRSSDRTGSPRGEGSGFLLAPDGILVTNLHVIGEGRDFVVELEDGTVLKPTAIVAFDREADVVVIELEKKGLPGLELGDAAALEPGQTLVAVGNPLGLGIGVSQGTYSRTRETEGRNWLQVAMPIEPGSSGSPLIALDGKVVGVLAVKSGSSTAFAVPAGSIRALLERPSPMPLERWLRIGALDPELWRPVAGGQWRQRAGRLVASGLGSGFGGRTLCLRGDSSPGPDLDLTVEVRLADESGAAGLAFHADGGDRHYGFYPTAGSLRLTRFEGPDVFSWTILRTVSSGHYRPGEWNEVRVRVRGPRLSCLVNGHVVIEVEDDGLAPGQVGLVKFREPGAEFRRFRAAAELPPSIPAAAAAGAADLAARIGQAPRLARSDVDALAALGSDGLAAVRGEAADLEKRAARLRSAAERARSRVVTARLAAVLSGAEVDVDLLQAALLVAQLDDADLEIEPYVEIVDRMGRRASAGLSPTDDLDTRLRAVLEHFTSELGFRGSRLEYYTRANSYLNAVIDDREGIPITLSVLFVEIARRAGLPASGVAAPRHFLVQVAPPDGEARLVDAFGGRVVSREEAEELCGAPLTAADLAPAPKRAIISRMLRNLAGIAQSEDDGAGLARYLDTLTAIGAASGQDRLVRAMLSVRAGELDDAAADLTWLMEHDAPGIDRAQVADLLERLRSAGAEER